jgi:triacylglycerol lipase
MPVSKLNDPQAAQQALLAMFAEDMFDPDPSHWNPAGAAVAAKGWTIIGYLTAANAVLEGQRLGLGQRVYFGFVAQSTTAAGKFIAVIRGTEQFVEWIENIEGLLVPYAGGGCVEDGFFSIYASMYFTLATAAGPTVNNGPQDDSKAARGIASILPPHSEVTVIGHSLGAAMATYLMLDLAESANGAFSVKGALFASPNTGNAAFVQRVDHAITDYKLYDYIFDLVTHVPPRLPVDPLGIGFHPLPKAKSITSNNRQARIKQDIFCNHHAYCYAAMLDYSSVATSATTAECIEGKA